MYKLIVSISIILIIYLYLIHLSKNNTSKPEYKENEYKVYLLTVSNYTQWILDFQGLVADAFVGYEFGNKIVPWQEELAQCYVDVYKTYNMSFTTKTLPPLTMKFIKSLPNQPQTLTPDDVISIIQPLITNFVPDVPTSISFYSYQMVDTSKTFYIKNSARISTLQNAVDLALSYQTQFFVNSGIVKVLDDTTKNDYISIIKKEALDYFIRPVTYTYFDPLEIYLNPKRFTLNMGVGIMDLTQPKYTIYVNKNQLESLNRLLLVSNINTPLIHPFFELPNYQVKWDDSWVQQLFDNYDKYIKNNNTTYAFQKTISDLLNKQGLNIILDYKKASSYFKLLLSDFYWVITLLSLFNPNSSDEKNKLLLQYLSNAGYNPQPCYDYCTNQKNICISESIVLTTACELTCGHESSEECEYNCDILSNILNQSCNTDLETCKAHCLSDGNLPSVCSSNKDCLNNACGRITAADYEPDVCCPSGTIVDFFSNDYCTDMPSGSECWADSMCATGYCESSDWLIKKKGQCLQKN